MDLSAAGKGLQRSGVNCFSGGARMELGRRGRSVVELAAVGRLVSVDLCLRP